MSTRTLTPKPLPSQPLTRKPIRHLLLILTPLLLLNPSPLLPTPHRKLLPLRPLNLPLRFPPK